MWGRLSEKLNQYPGKEEKSKLAIWHHTKESLSVVTTVISPEPQLLISVHFISNERREKKRHGCMRLWSPFWPSSLWLQDDFCVFRFQFSFSGWIRRGRWKTLKGRGWKRICFKKCLPKSSLLIHPIISTCVALAKTGSHF